MNLNLFLVITLLQVFSAHATTPRCHEHEEYRHGNVCDENCSRNLMLCTDNLELGCFCKDGYLRNAAGRCVLTEECFPDENEVCDTRTEYFSVCGYPCLQTCEYNFFGGFCTTDVGCHKGCHCKQGLFRNSAGRCVPAEECFYPVPCSESEPDSICPRHEVYKECGSTCSETCQSHLTPVSCLYLCESGCFCKDNYYRNSDGECVPQDECCPEGEIFLENGNYCLDSCDLFHHPGKQCPVYGMKGCFCPNRQYRDCSGSCVKKEHCCPANEVYLKCGYECDDSCAGYLSLRPCPRMHCEEGCYCQEGYYRNVQGVCVREEQCYPEYERLMFYPHSSTVIIT